MFKEEFLDESTPHLVGTDDDDSSRPSRIGEFCFFGIYYENNEIPTHFRLFTCHEHSLCSRRYNVPASALRYGYAYS